MAGETRTLEFKVELPEESVKRVKTIVAFANGTFIRLNATTRNADAANLDELELRKKRKYYDELPMAMSLASIAKSSLQNNFWCKVFFECL